MSTQNPIQAVAGLVKKIGPSIQTQVKARAVQASNVLRNSALEVLRGKRSGRIYKRPGTYGAKRSAATKSLLAGYGHKLRGGQLYQASAPGEPPAARTNELRRSFRPIPYAISNGYTSAIETDVPYAGLLEDGTPQGMIKPRPYRDQIIEQSQDQIEQIFSAPYKIP